MVNYHFEGDRFVIEDFQKAKTFASFLPGVAGVDGKPLWAFYASVGQGMGGFGVTSKDTPITPFDSANLAYSNIPVKGFRTFLKEDGVLHQPFFNHENVKQTMETSMADFSIDEASAIHEMHVLYATLPHRDYAALIRKVTYTNISAKPVRFTVVDGLPVFFPNGLSNFCYKELVSLMAAYCQVYGLKEKTPFVKFKTSTGDNSIVQEAVSGNGFFAIDEKGNKLTPLIDPQALFGDDMTDLSVDPFEKLSYPDFLKQDEQTENKLPCAFYSFEKTLKPQESYTVYAVYGMWDDFDKFIAASKELTPEILEQAILDNRQLIKDLVHPAECHTGNPLFDLYLKQSYLDNNLRGGFPTLLPDKKEGQVYYIYGRKHGDMERDYNAFQIPSRFYSSGPGNFRDVNQNRRSDLIFHPYVSDYNIKLFFNLIQVDGQNPLNVKPETFILDSKALSAPLKALPKADLEKILALGQSFEPSEMYTLLRDGLAYEKTKADDLFAEILSSSKQEIQANFAEGYWVDHWTYNVDLLENYSSIFPDKEEALFFTKDYGYFYDPVYVNPRSEKYCLLPDGKVRQYGAIDLKALKEKCEKTDFDLQKTAWLADENGEKITCTLAEKIIGLILVKFSTLDSAQMGIEMECEKPGWNDAMNGLPGLFASGVSESVELLRLVRYASKHLKPFAKRKISLLPEQYQLYVGMREALEQLQKQEITRFQYWDRATSLRENLRKSYQDHAESARNEVDLVHLLAFLQEMDAVLSDGLKRAKEAGKGILPSYLIYRVASYEKSDKTNHLGYPIVKVTSFALETLPPFLEASARALKLADGTLDKTDYETIKASDLYDHTLHFYKTCAAIDDAPFEIGRVHAFTKGWLERECNFLHMDYKYMLGLLEAGFYSEFFAEIKDSFVVYMDPFVYGRNPSEASSFVVPTCNPDSSKHGRGYFARLTGANAEFLNMAVLLFAGDSLFSNEGGKLHFHLEPKLSKDFFDEKGDASFLLFSHCEVVYHNPDQLDCYKGVKLHYSIAGKSYETIDGGLAEDIRSGKIAKIDVRISR